MNTILDEYQKAMDQVQNKLKPVLEKVKASRLALSSGKDADIETKHGMSYLEMKYNLMVSYCSFLSFYLLLKLEGKDVSEHPVISKLVHIKIIFEKLRPLDQKLQYQVEKLMKQAALAESFQDEEKVLGKRQKPVKDDLRFKPNLAMLEDQEDEDSEGDEENAQSGESAGDFDSGEDDESEISDDKPKKADKKGPKKIKDGDKAEKDIYKPAKLNPIMYQDQVEKRTKKIQREETHSKSKLSKHNYIQMLKEEMDDRPEEVMGAFGQGKKTQYIKDMETLEKVELQNFTRMTMTKAQKKFHRQQMLGQNVDKLDQIDEFKDIENIIYNRADQEIDRDNLDASAQLGSNKFKSSMKSYLKKEKSKNSNKRQKTM